ncbi:MaoC/PaaZ C-terminal domain-containing protein [Pseudonocardia pini]|uniref:MaoC/PaaZ C-terminal domain-containing protein n=1 Tax=Pseudonocardia pini TaxID=2758030 RepID=UPI0028A627E1|nr:MaoC/PaaZ C-terminal domain-containing protein [Pseudonocardia pini]
MSIDLTKALGAELTPADYTYTTDDVILYHLALGAGVPPTARTELAYTYEDGLVTLPTFGVLPPLDLVVEMIGAPGMAFDPTMLLHGEQDITAHRPFPTSGTVRTTGRIAEIWDKGKAALVVLTTETSDADGPIMSSRISAFIRGEGGFGGERGPTTGLPAPQREPDHVLRTRTLPQQALIYRLTGDKNPLHADPGFAARAGFDRPILHGLCTYGVVCRAVVDEVLGSVDRVGRYMVRFAGSVFPGETVVTNVWREGGRLLLSATTEERGAPVLSNSFITVRD